MVFDDRYENALRFLYGLQKMDDAELGHVARKPGQVGEHDAPFLAEQVPYPRVYQFLVRTGLNPFPDQFLEPVLGRADKY